MEGSAVKDRKILRLIYPMWETGGDFIRRYQYYEEKI